MAQFAFTNGYLLVNAVDLSAYSKSITLNVSADMLDKTTMADTTHEMLAGLKDWSVEVQFTQDFGAALVDATLFPLIGAAAFAVEVRPTSSARGATNPGYNGNAVLESYTPLSGAVGDLAVATARFRAAGALTRSVS